MLAQINQTPGTDPIALGLRPVQNVGLERRLLTRAELLRPTGTRAVMQTVRSLGIEALDGIVQGLTLHTGQPSGFGPGHAFQGIGDGQQPQAGPGIPLTSSPLAQVGC